jgi:DNA mismatch repair ATPase MutS
MAKTKEAGTREAYREKMEAKLKEWSAKIDEMKARAAHAKGDMKLQYNKQLEELRERREKLQKRLREFRESSEETWEKLKVGVDKAATEFRESIEKAFARFK